MTHQNDAAGGTGWIGGVKYGLCKQQYQILFLEYGPKNAKMLAEELINWPDDRRPPPHIYYDWGEEAANDQSNIPYGVERAFRRQLDNQLRATVTMSIRETAAASRSYARMVKKLADQAESGNFDPDLLKVLKETSSAFMHANNGTGFMYREVINGGGFKMAPQQVNTFGNVKIITNRGKEKKQVVEAEVRELAAG